MFEVNLLEHRYDRALRSPQGPALHDLHRCRSKAVFTVRTCGDATHTREPASAAVDLEGSPPQPGEPRRAITGRLLSKLAPGGPRSEWPTTTRCARYVAHDAKCV